MARTIACVLAASRGDTEVIGICDGGWAMPEIADHPRVHLVKTGAAIGQRAATNLGAKLSSARYIMKLDAHCDLSDGFDVELVKTGDELGHDVTQIPAQHNLHAFNWKCLGCGHETYQGPMPTTCIPCAAKGTTGGPFERVMYWDLKCGGVPGRPMRTEAWYFDHELHFQYDSSFIDSNGQKVGCYRNRPEARGDVADVMSSLGACFVMRRARFFELGGLDEAAGSWGTYGTEIACKSWLSGGRHVVNKRCWFAHMFRTQNGWSFPYSNPASGVAEARKYHHRLWLHNAWPQQTRPLSWLIDKFAPLPGWHQSVGAKRLAQVQASGAAFAQRLKAQTLGRAEVGEVPGVLASEALAASNGAVALIANARLDDLWRPSDGDGMPSESGAFVGTDGTGAPSLTGRGDCDQRVPVLAVGLSAIERRDGVGASEVGGVGDEPQVCGVATGRCVADNVVEFVNVSPARNGADEPGKEQPVDPETWVVLDGPRKTVDGDLSVAPSVLTSSPDPTTGAWIGVDFGKQSDQSSRVEVVNGKMLDSHASASSADVGSEPGQRSSAVSARSSILPSKGIVFYSDCRGDETILSACRQQLQRCANGHPIVSVTLQPLDFCANYVLPLARGYLTMFLQILRGLEALDADVAFLCEHDVVYHPSHFDFVPPDRERFFYNTNVFKVDASTGHALHYRCSQTSGLCASRDLLIEHYRARVARVEREGFSRSMGFEPGTRQLRHGGIDDRQHGTWMSAVPNIDIRHGHNLTPSRWKKEQFRNQRYTEGWTESDSVPGWGRTEGRFREFLAGLSSCVEVGA